MRIVSLLPSSTEIVCELGLHDMLVGVTHECDYPASVHSLPKVTRTAIPQNATSSEIDLLVRERLTHQKALYHLDIPSLLSLNPDLIITQALCDVCAVAESEVVAAAQALPSHPKVINLEPSSLNEVFDCMRLVGSATGTVQKSESAIAKLQARVDQVCIRTRKLLTPLPRVVILEWIDPLFSAGHWSPELVTMAGGVECIGQAGQRSRTITWKEVTEADPDVLILACCGFNTERTLQDVPILKSFPKFASLSCAQSNRIYVIDGNSFFSRPGPRLVDSLELLSSLMHPKTHPLPIWAQPGRDFAQVQSSEPTR